MPLFLILNRHKVAYILTFCPLLWLIRRNGRKLLAQILLHHTHIHYISYKNAKDQLRVTRHMKEIILLAGCFRASWFKGFTDAVKKDFSSATLIVVLT